MEEGFLQILEEHAKRYPLMQPQDFGKLAYQSEFGPSHLLCDKQRAISALIDEWVALAGCPAGNDVSVYRKRAAGQHGGTDRKDRTARAAGRAWHA